MGKHFPTVVLLLLLSSAAPSRAATKITGELAVKTNGMVKLVAETDVKGGGVIWFAFAADGKPVAAADLYKDAAKKLLIFTGKPGSYYVSCAVISSADGRTDVEEADVTVTIGDAPAPPGPGPTPNPPVPDDALTRAVRDAYAADPDVNKAANVRNLARVYRAASSPSTTAGSGGANDPQLTSYAQLLTKMHNAAGGLGVPADGIQKVRAAVGGYLDVTLGVGSAAGAARPIDRPLATAELAKIAAVLEGMKP